MMWFTCKTLDFRLFYHVWKCVFWSMLWAEWLHSSVHGSPGESPWGGAVPSGEQRQPEYSHWGTVCVCANMCMCASPPVSAVNYSMTPCIFSASVLYSLYICCTNHLHLLSSSVSFLLPLPRPHSLCICLALNLAVLSWLSCLCLFHFLSVSYSLSTTSLAFQPSFPAFPLSSFPSSLGPHLFMRE